MPGPHVLFLFVDGIGLGSEDPEVNPMARDWPGFLAFSAGHRWVQDLNVRTSQSTALGLDANLGLPGLPQSGTGQVSLYTGINAAELAGRHYGPYPHSKTRQALRSENVFGRYSSAAFANAYPPRFFSWVERTGRWPVTTQACLDAGIRIRTIEDLEAGAAVAADVTGRGLARDLGLPVTEILPSEAATRLIALAQRHRFTLFEVFHTDKAGHAQDMSRAEAILEPLDRLLEALVAVRPAEMTIVLTSDHGNLEDLSVKTHTRNQVPLAVLGPGAPAFSSAESLCDVVPALDHILLDR